MLYDENGYNEVYDVYKSYYHACKKNNKEIIRINKNGYEEVKSISINKIRIYENGKWKDVWRKEEKTEMIISTMPN